MKFLEKSLLVRLVSYFLLLSLTSVILTGYIAFHCARKAITQVVFNKLNAIAEHKKGELNSWVADQRQDVLLIASLPQIRKWADFFATVKKTDPEYQSVRTQISDYLVEIAARKPDMQEVFLLSTNGKVIISTNKAHEGKDHSDDIFFTKGRLRIFIQSPYSGVTGLEQTMTIALPLLNAVGRQLGIVLAAHLNLNRVDKIILRRIGPAESGETYLVGKHNNLVSRHDSEESKVASMVHSDGIDAAIRNGRNGQGMYLDYRRIPVIGVYNWLDEYEMALMTEMSQDKAFAPARRLAKVIILVGLTLSGLLAFGVFVLARRITKPILVIKEAALQVAGGSLEVEVPALTKDEIGVLARTFNQMTAQLKTVYEKLRQREAHFRSLIENGSDLIAVINAQGDIKYVSPSATHILGRSPDRLEGMNIFELFHPDDLNRIRQSISECLANPECILSTESRIRHRDGRWHLLEGIGQNLLGDAAMEGIVINFREITDRKRAEDTLRKSEEKYRSIFENAIEGIFQTLPDGRFLNANPSMARILGYDSPEELVLNVTNISKQIYVNPEDHEVWDRMLREEGRVIGFETQLYRKDGSIVWVSTSTRAVRDESGNVLFYEGLLLDITEKKEKEKAEIEREAAQAATKSKSTFLANMSHELRTPLNVIMGYSQLMQKEILSPAEQREYLNTINRNGEYLLALINDVLELSKIEAGQLTVENTAFDLHALFVDLEEAFASSLEDKGLFFEIIGLDDVPRYVATDETKLRQVMVNILGNAVKFTEQGGITVRVAAKDETAGAVRLAVEVQDTGVGIAKDEQDKVFAYFEQTAGGRARKSGTGLGMAISRNYVRMLGGDISVTSKAGKGSTFYFNIDIQKSSKSHIKEKISKPQVIGLAPGQDIPRVLVAEDIEASRILLVNILKTAGFDVQEAVNGWQAVEIFHNWRPHFIWMDIRMPVMDGMEATRHIKEADADKSTIVAALTAHALEEEREQILAAGCDDFVRKPFRDREIFEVMAKHLGLKYVYKQEPVKPDAGVETEAQVTSQQLAALPADISNRLRQAAVELNKGRILKIIEQIKVHDADMADMLKTIVNKLEFHRLLDLFQDVNLIGAEKR